MNDWSLQEQEEFLFRLIEAERKTSPFGVTSFGHTWPGSIGSLAVHCQPQGVGLSAVRGNWNDRRLGIQHVGGTSEVSL